MFIEMWPLLCCVSRSPRQMGSVTATTVPCLSDSHDRAMFDFPAGQHMSLCPCMRGLSARMGREIVFIRCKSHHGNLSALPGGWPPLPQPGFMRRAERLLWRSLGSYALQISSLNDQLCVFRI